MKLFVYIASVGVFLLMMWYLWRRFILRRSGSSLTALVFLMSAPRRLDEQKVRAAIKKAWGVELGSEMQQGGEWLVEAGKVNPAMASPHASNYLVSAHGRMFLINSVEKPYMDHPDKFAEENIADLRLRNAVANHNAWNSVDLFGATPAEDEKAEVYGLLGKLLVEFVGDDCLALYSPGLDRCNEVGPSVIEGLRSGNVLEVFGEPTFAPVVQVDGKDPRMLAAVEEAQRRWPEFVGAFTGRSTGNDMFVVKARFAEGEDEEFMWVSVREINGDTIHGRLENAPAALKSIKEGDSVSVQLDQLNDWMYAPNRGSEPVGGFTMKVMADALKK